MRGTALAASIAETPAFRQPAVPERAPLTPPPPIA
jgi:hypothetical protein